VPEPYDFWTVCEWCLRGLPPIQWARCDLCGWRTSSHPLDDCSAAVAVPRTGGGQIAVSPALHAEMRGHVCRCPVLPSQARPDTTQGGA
jgi:hypothetical protein